MKQKILFVCIHNSARSQIAEAVVNRFYNDKYEAYSAGIEPGKLNPLVVKSMMDLGIDISQNKTKSTDEILKTGQSFDYVITVCEKEAAEKCPVFPGNGKRIQWWFNDPSKLQGSEEDKLKNIAKIRDEIKDQIESFINELNK